LGSAEAKGEFKGLEDFLERFDEVREVVLKLASGQPTFVDGDTAWMRSSPRRTDPAGPDWVYFVRRGDRKWGLVRFFPVEVNDGFRKKHGPKFGVLRSTYSWSLLKRGGVVRLALRTNRVYPICNIAILNTQRRTGAGIAIDITGRSNPEFGATALGPASAHFNLGNLKGEFSLTISEGGATDAYRLNVGEGSFAFTCRGNGLTSVRDDAGHVVLRGEARMDVGPAGRPSARGETRKSDGPLPFKAALGELEITRPGVFVIRGYIREGGKRLPLRIAKAPAPKIAPNWKDLQAKVDSRLDLINKAADRLLGEPRNPSYRPFWHAFDRTHNKAMFEYSDNDGNAYRKAYAIVDPQTGDIEQVIFTGPMPYKR